MPDAGAKGPAKAAKIKKDAEGAMAPSQADPTNDGALAIKDETRSRSGRNARPSADRNQKAKGNQ